VPGPDGEGAASGYLQIPLNSAVAGKSRHRRV
jgi:hypothetical protein